MNSGGPAQAPTWLAPVVSSDRPLREPDSALAHVQNARIGRGFTPTGLDHPRGRLWVAAVMPAGIADAVAAVGFLGTGSALAAAATIGLSVAVAGAAAFVRLDPLRITSAQRRQLSRDRTWRSAHAWLPPLTDTPERLLLAEAQNAVARIVGSATWWHERTAVARTRLDLGDELDEVDGQAFRLAHLPTDDPSRPGLRATLAARVQALTALADELARLDHLATRSRPGTGDEVQQLQAVAGAVRDEYATDHVRELTEAIARTEPP